VGEEAKDRRHLGLEALDLVFLGILTVLGGSEKGTHRVWCEGGGRGIMRCSHRLTYS
jgi:hypothetical protein